jgi:hypothetical protein
VARRSEAPLILLFGSEVLPPDRMLRPFSHLTGQQPACRALGCGSRCVGRRCPGDDTVGTTGTADLYAVVEPEHAPGPPGEEDLVELLGARR